MNKKISFLSVVCIGLLTSSQLFAESILWKDVSPQINGSDEGLQARTESSVLKARRLELNLTALSEQLNIAPANSLSRAVDNSEKDLVITIPLPDGGEISVKAEESSVLSDELAKRYPQIKTWRVVGTEDPSIHGRIDITEQGFHSMLVMQDGDTIFIDPDKKVKNQYLSFSQRANSQNFKTNFQCGFDQENTSINGVVSRFLNESNNTSNRLASRKARTNVTYRLAVATTGEYTQFHGGTKSLAYSAVVTTINRVNEVFERDLSLKLKLVSGEEIIYTNPFTDPYTNSDTQEMLEQNIVNLSDSGDFSSNRYDIGHVFGTRGNLGGLAALGSVCGSSKAAGVTGISNPIGDAFDISFVAHEMGHQLGATHTFNSACGGGGKRTPETAVEPGSGSTIMSYAGVCGSNDNLQSNSDPLFHITSISQIDDFIENKGLVCGTEQATNNEKPEIDAGSDYTIPTGTPFNLVAEGTDSDGDTLSYTWDQIDVGTESEVDVDTGDNAIFRSRPENISPVRFIPRLEDLFNGTRVKGERLPIYDRDVNFVSVARDGKGGVWSDRMKIKLVSTGRPFSVTSHRFSETLRRGDSTTVTWDVAGTNSSPISCSNVNIWLLNDNGDDYLLTETKNDGEKRLVIPDDIVTMDNARFVVACSDNIFFNVSNAVLKVREKTTTNSNPNSDSSGGGSMGFFLLTIALLGFRRFNKKEALK